MSFFIFYLVVLSLGSIYKKTSGTQFFKKNCLVRENRVIAKNKYVIKMVKESKTVGHIPQLFLRLFSLTLLSDGSMKVRGTGKQEKQRENGLKVSCIVTIKISEYMYIKVETITCEDLCGRLV